ncbi:MAG: hypothetical protein NXI22_10310 [bacterium]|nr:hypothetical protein [bacterium]
MSSEVVVREKPGQWSVVLYFVGPFVMAIGGGMIAAGNGFNGIGVLVIGAVLAVVLTAVCLIYNRQFRTVTDTGTGFIVSDAAGDRMFDDSDVESFAYDLTPFYDNGSRVGEIRYFQIWVRQESKPIEMLNVIKARDGDPLLELIERIAMRQHDQAIDALAAGGGLSGDGWQLSAKALKLDAQSESVPIKEIVTIDCFEKKLCLWRTGEAEAFARLAVDARNAYLLRKLLGSWIDERNQNTGYEPSAPGLGRILFKKEGAVGRVLFLFTLGIVSLAIAGGLLLRGDVVEIVGFLFCLAGIACFLGAYGVSRTRFHCHELGVHQRRWFGESTLRYVDLAAFTDASRRYFTNGKLSNAMIQMTFEPKPGIEGAKTIYLNTMLNGADGDFDKLRDHVSAVMARQIDDELAAKGSAPWTANTTFLKDGIEHRPVGIYSDKWKVVFVPWDKFFGFFEIHGMLYMMREGSTSPFGEEQATERNYLPGRYYLAMTGRQLEARPSEDVKA